MQAFTIESEEPLTQEQLDRMAAASRDPDLLDLVQRNRPGDSTEPLTMMGAEYPFAGITLPPVSLGTIYALAMIGSPFVNEADGATPTDIMVAAYVIACGPDAIQPIMGLQWRLRAFRQVEKVAASSPELFAVYLDKLTAVSADGAQLDRAALAWWDALPEPIAMNDAGAMIEQAIVDAYCWTDCFRDTAKSSDALPEWSPESLGMMIAVAANELGHTDDRALWMPLASLGYQIVAQRARESDTVGREPDWGTYIRRVKERAGLAGK